MNGTLGAPNSNTTVNITDAVALGSVPLDGSAVLWLATASGLRWSAITNITGSSGAWVVTVATAYTVTITGLTWAIGGKRATISGSTQLFADWLNWTIILNNTTPFSITAALVISGGGTSALGYGIIQGNSTVWGSQTVITSNLNGISFSVTGGSKFIRIQNLNFQNTNAGSGTIALSNSAATNDLVVESCVLGDATNKLQSAFQVTSTGATTFRHCEIKSCKGSAIILNSGSATPVTRVIDCYVHGGTTSGITTPAAFGSLEVLNSIFALNTTTAIILNAGSGNALIVGNTIDSNTTAGIDMSASTGFANALIMNNNITNNGTGIIGKTSAAFLDSVKLFIDYNNVWNNNTANYTNISAGVHDTSVNPGYVGAPNYTPTANFNKAYPDSTLPIGGAATGSLNFSTQGAVQEAPTTPGPPPVGVNVWI